MRTTILLTAVLGMGVVQPVRAAAHTVVYNATGTFATLPLSGADQFKLAGEPFNLSLTVSEATKPVKQSMYAAQYANIPLSGTVHSGNFPEMPIPIPPNQFATFSLEVGAPGQPDLGTVQATVLVLGTPIAFSAKFVLPPGTLTGKAIRPFTAPVTLTPSDAALKYDLTQFEGGTTTLVTASGSLTTTVQ